MEILWLAIVFYSLGLGLILHFRPSMMFHENGTWKEFGYKRSPGTRYTLFPFWLFAIAWAFASYVLAAVVTWVLPSMSIATAGAAATTTFSTSYLHTQSEDSDSESEGEEAEAEADTITSVSSAEPKRKRGRPRKSEAAPKPRPGYYVLDPESRKGGLRKYVYYGENPPTDEESA